MSEEKYPFLVGIREINFAMKRIDGIRGEGYCARRFEKAGATNRDALKLRILNFELGVLQAEREAAANGAPAAAAPVTPPAAPVAAAPRQPVVTQAQLPARVAVKPAAPPLTGLDRVTAAFKAEAARKTAGKDGHEKTIYEMPEPTGVARTIAAFRKQSEAKKPTTT